MQSLVLSSKDSIINKIVLAYAVIGLTIWGEIKSNWENHIIRIKFQILLN